MDFLYQNLPKDLVYIIQDYAKDRTQYNKVIEELEYCAKDQTNYDKVIRQLKTFNWKRNDTGYDLRFMFRWSELTQDYGTSRFGGR